MEPPALASQAEASAQVRSPRQEIDMDDTEIVNEIDRLVDEEHRLERGHDDQGLSDADRDRLARVEAQLDQCWDLLRQRRARRNAGQDPDDTAVRPANVVEHYQQ